MIGNRYIGILSPYLGTWAWGQSGIILFVNLSNYPNYTCASARTLSSIRHKWLSLHSLALVIEPATSPKSISFVQLFWYMHNELHVINRILLRNKRVLIASILRDFMLESIHVEKYQRRTYFWLFTRFEPSRGGEKTHAGSIIFRKYRKGLYLSPSESQPVSQDDPPLSYQFTLLSLPTAFIGFTKHLINVNRASQLVARTQPLERSYCVDTM